jgi:type I restriction enzyme, S subunit
MTKDLPTPSRLKDTEIGPLPFEWAVDRVGQVARISTGARNTQDRVKDGAYPFFVRSQQVERINSYSFDGEAVLTAGDGVGTGKVFHYIVGRFDVHQRVYRISDFRSDVNGRYFFYQFSNRFYKRVISMTAKSSVDSVRLDMVAGMAIPIPSLPEQQAIVSALSDADSLLSYLDALIT